MSKVKRLLGEKITSLLWCALRKDERQIAPTKARGDQRIWSVRQYSENWLQYVLMKAANHGKFCSLNFEHAARGHYVDVVAYDTGGNALCYIELKGPGRPDERFRVQVLSDVKRQRARSSPKCEKWVLALIHGQVPALDSWQKDFKVDLKRVRGRATCVVKTGGEITLNRDPNGADFKSSLRIIQIRIPGKQPRRGAP
jgi:hypothetical protein